MDGTITRRQYGRGHGYKDSHGAKIKGVTTWLSEGTAKPALVNWAAGQAAGYCVDHWDELLEETPSGRLDAIKKGWRKSNKEAMSTGTEVHSLAEGLVKGEEIDVPEHVAGHLEAYSRFLEDFDPAPIVVEGVVGNLDVTPAYAGTLDLIADLNDGNRWLLDIKTGKSIWGEVGLQLAAYRYATTLMVDGEPQPMPDVDKTGVIHVRSDGYDLREVKADPDVFRMFRYCQMSAVASDESKNWIGDAIQPTKGETK